MPAPCSEPDCAKPVRKRGLCNTHYNKANGYSWHKDPERERARQRLKTHRRKDWSRLTDITPEYELGLRVKARRCPLCAVKLTDDPYLPHSKELDHIIPRGVGGTHTMGNVRILCRSCNLARPKDGSDYSGPVTLWAQDPAALIKVRRVRLTCPTCDDVLRAHRCWTCQPSRHRYRAEGGRRAARMRADGHKWQEIADVLGFTNPGGAYCAAKMYGDPCDVVKWLPGADHAA